MSLSKLSGWNTITFANSSKNSKWTKNRIFKEIKIINHSVKNENENIIKWLPLSQFSLNYESYWKITSLYLIMKHCKGAKHGNNL